MDFNTKSTGKYRDVFQDSSISTVIINRDNQILHANNAFCNLVGFNHEELENIKIQIITHPDDICNCIRSHERLFAGEISSYQIEIHIVHKNGSVISSLVNTSIVLDDNARPDFAIAQFQDVSEERHLTSKLLKQTRFDVLTDLINRDEFKRRLSHFVDTAHDTSTVHALCYLDLDLFKVINDTCGHVAGDEMLRLVGKILKKSIRKQDTLARLGGDEFGIIFQGCSIDEASQITAKLQDKIKKFIFIWDKKKFNVGVSIGLVEIDQHSHSATEILKEADMACYIAKDSGRNRVHVYSHDEEKLVQRKGEMYWVSKINEALEDDRFRLFAQPIINIANSETSLPHYELLVRIEEENGDIISPGVFLPAAERYNLITNIDRWVIKASFKMMDDHPHIMSQLKFCSINISGQSLTEPDFLKYIVNQLRKNTIDPEKICFEITETAAIANMSAATSFISTLKAFGCQFALDDFGSGLSSFAYLKNLSVDYLKIDGMLIKDIVNSHIDYEMVKMIHGLGHVMGMQTIAEFVENDLILEKIGEIGIDSAQGYSIGMPQPLQDFFLDNSRNIKIPHLTNNYCYNGVIHDKNIAPS